MATPLVTRARNSLLVVRSAELSERGEYETFWYRLTIHFCTICQVSGNRAMPISVA